MELKELLTNTRSIRKFKNEVPVDTGTLKELVALTRLCPSGGNRQPLRYLLVNGKNDCAFIAANLKWAALLADWEGPEDREKPAAYIIILTDRTIAENAPYDSGIAAHTMIMGAVEKGLAGCMLGNVNRSAVSEHFGIDRERYAIDLVVALGVPAEESVIEDAGESVVYYRDENNLFHVPKRKSEDLVEGIFGRGWEPCF